MKKDPKVYLEHIVESIRLIEDYSLNLTSEKFEADSVIQDAIIPVLKLLERR